MKNPVYIIVDSLTYVVSFILIKAASNEESPRKRSEAQTEEEASPPDFKPYDDRMIRFAAFLYKRSWIRKYLHRDGKGNCIFIPSCSDYCVRAVQKYGLKKGLLLTGARLKRCNPRDQGDAIDFP
jgi:putative component of membrane protein insertase Oxa1/YidC/SpoIIIJ protein YidD